MIEEHEEDQKNDNHLDLQGYSLLERAIRLLRKNTHYQLKDDIRGTTINIAYGIPYESSPTKNQHALKVFWRCLITRFFKPIENFDIQVLKYYRLLVNTPIQQISLPFLNPVIYETISKTLYMPTMSKYGTFLDYQNLVHHLFFEFFCIQTKSSDKKIINSLKCLRRQKYNHVPRFRTEIYDETQQLLKQRFYLQGLLNQCVFTPYLDNEDEISKQIEVLEAELAEINEFNKVQLDKITTKSNDEVMMKSQIYIINSQEQKQHAEIYREKILEQWLVYNHNMLERIELQKKYLESTILDLQFKQVAESISKVYQKEKSNDTFFVMFQKGLNLSPIPNVPVIQLRAMDKIRDVSLLKFYNTSMKTRNYSICPLISGFQLLFKKKSIQPFRNKDLVLEMKEQKLSKDLKVITPDTEKAFQSYDICHHCRQLYQSVYLVKCSYHSSLVGPPTQNLSFIDPYIQQILNRQTLSSTRNFVNNQKNPYMDYHKKGGQHICQRKYCKFCLRQNYDGNQNSNMCPFCQGICFCSRCLRNDTIIKLKTMYSLMAGDVPRLNRKSLLYRLSKPGGGNNLYQQEIDDSEDENQDNNGGSSKQNAIWKNFQKQTTTESLKVTYRQFMKLRDIREDLQQCRQVCQLVKRREKQKLYIVQNQQKIFMHIVNDLDVDFKVGKRPRIMQPLEIDKGRKTRKMK